MQCIAAAEAPPGPAIPCLMLTGGRWPIIEPNNDLRQWRLGEVMPEEKKELQRAELERVRRTAFEASTTQTYMGCFYGAITGGRWIYDNPVTQVRFDGFNQALDCVVIELPHPVEPEQPDDAIDDSWLDGHNGAKRTAKPVSAQLRPPA